MRIWLLLLAPAAFAQHVPPALGVTALADCLSRAAAMDQLDGDLDALAARDRLLRAAVDELRLRRATLRPTAQIDAGAAATYAAYGAELRAAEATGAALDSERRETLEARRALARDYAEVCAGRSYTKADRAAAEALLADPN